MSATPKWIMGYANLERYMGGTDKQGRMARKFAEAERLTVKFINGTPRFPIADVEAALRNGKPCETR